MPGYTVPAKVMPLDEMVNDPGDVEAGRHPTAERTAVTKLKQGDLPLEVCIDKLL